MMPRNS